MLTWTLLEIESRIKLSNKREGVERKISAVKSIETYPKTFYKFAKKTATIKSRIIVAREGFIENDSDTGSISQILSEQFKSVCTLSLWTHADKNFK